MKSATRDIYQCKKQEYEEFGEEGNHNLSENRKSFGKKMVNGKSG